MLEPMKPEMPVMSAVAMGLLGRLGVLSCGRDWAPSVQGYRRDGLGERFECYVKSGMRCHFRSGGGVVRICNLWMRIVLAVG
jgi:hypothetical protein